MHLGGGGRPGLEGSLCLVYPAEDPVGPDGVARRTLPIPRLPVPAGVMSQASWGCHVHTPAAPPPPRPLAPLLSTRLQSLASHCDPGTVDAARTNANGKTTRRVL